MIVARYRAGTGTRPARQARRPRRAYATREAIVSEGVADRTVDQLELDVRVCRLDGIDLRGHGVCHDHVAGSLGAQDAEAHHGRTVETGEGPRLGDRIGDEAEIIEPNLAAIRQRNAGRREIDDGLGAGERADRLLASADFGAAAGQIDIAAAELTADIEWRQADSLQPHRVEPDTHFALHGADELDAADAAHAL